jgi:iron complex outermembrane receptor protein
MNLKRLHVAVTLAMFAFSVPALAQNKEVTGKVTEVKDGSPLAGVTIAVAGTQIPTAPDANGVFRLKVPAVAKKLTISSIGYATREVNLETGEMSIALSPVSTA